MKKEYDCKVHTYDQDGRCLLLQDFVEDIAAYIRKLDESSPHWTEIELFLPSSTLAIFMGNDDRQFIGKVVNPISLQPLLASISL